MSVIYDSLTKLTTSGKRGAGTAGKAKQGPGRGILNSSSSPKKSVLGLAIIIVAVGLFGYFWMDELKGLGGARIELPDKSHVVTKRMPEHTEKRIEIKPPAQTEPQVQPNAAEENLAADSQYLPPQKDAVQTPKKDAQVVSALGKASIAGEEKPAQPEKTAAKESESTTATVAPAAQQPAESPAGESSSKNSGGIKKKPQKTQEEKHLEILAKEQSIAELIKKIKLSMASSDMPHTEKLFARLEKIKGRNNSYVLNLRAFWCMQRGDHHLARPLLEKVLSRNENDREAGLNMAVLEINTNQLPEARARLRILKEAYPNDSSINELYLQLR